MKVALAHPSHSALQILQKALAKERGPELLWSTTQAGETLRMCAERPPDLMLLDVSFTQPSSVEIARGILAQTRSAILLLADRPHAHVSAIYEAMGLGALDVVSGPDPDSDGGFAGYDAFRAKLLTLGKMLGLPPPRRALSGGRSGDSKPRAGHPLVAIGASTGGPQALFRILSELPSQLGAALVIAQHVDSEFSAGLRSWLQQATSLRVELAAAGCRPAPGTVLLAATNDHLVLTAQRKFVYSAEPRKLPYRPSVDVLFRSLAEHWPSPAVAVLLTGMGRDGAQGLKQLRQLGWHTIAEAESSCVVFGMPKAAIELGAAQQILPLASIPAAIARACGGKG
jgi:two-component system, chemotaxis family, response regulator WspF